MTRFLRTAPLSLTAVALAFPALADFTAQEYWDYTIETARDQGSEVRANSVTRTSDGLIIEGVTLETDADGERFAFSLTGYTINNHEAGGVELLLPESQDLTVVYDGADSEPVALTFTITTQEFTSVVSGDLDKQNTMTRADEILVSLASVLVDGSPVEASGGVLFKEMQVASEGVTIDYSAPFSYDLNAALAEITFALALPEVGVTSASINRFEDLSAVVRVSPTDDPLDATGLIEFTAASSQGETQQSAPDTGTFSYTTSTDQIAYNGVLQDKVASLTSAVSGLQLDMDLQRLPIGPIALEASIVAAEVEIPIAASQESQAAALTLDLQGVRLSENVWRMVDPAGAIPRDPIAMVLELDADLNVSPQTTPSLPGAGELPVDIVPTALRIETLFAAIGGATLAGTGSFAFDPSDFPLTPGTAPTPDGTLDLSLTGGLELLQQMTNGGILTTEQAMGAQMMIGMMMREGPNGSLETQIKTGSDGSLSVNGNRLR